jgi:hypothetical protein
MNLMFRKNFREGGGSGGGGGGAKKSGHSKARGHSGKRSRDMGYGNCDDFNSHFRTHIFFSPSSRGLNQEMEGLYKYFFFSYFSTYVEEILLIFI